MCSVQVYLIGDVMRRTSSHRNNDQVRSIPRHICKKLLFGDEPTETRRDPAKILRKMEDDIREQQRNRWNFDFETETPLPGRYQWIPAGCSFRDTPSVIATSAADQTSPKVVEEVKSVPQAGPRVSATSHRRRCEGAVDVKQPKITDFLTQKKRHCTGDVVSSPKLKSRRTSTSTSSNSNLTTQSSTPLKR